MTRAGVGYVAMAAAAICAGTLGYAVIWSYGEAEIPPVALAAPPILPPTSETSLVASASQAMKDAPPAPANSAMPPVASAPPSVTATHPRIETSPAPVAADSPMASTPAAAASGGEVTASGPRTLPPPPAQEPAAQIAPAPANLPRATEAMLAPPDTRNEKPQAASAPKDTLVAISSVRPSAAPSKSESSAALSLPDRPQAAARFPKPSAQESPTLDMAEPSPLRAVEKPVIAPSPPGAEPPPERVTTASPPIKPAAAPRNSVALAPVTENPEPPPVLSVRPQSPGRLLKLSRRTAALPPAARSEHPHISVVRAGPRPGRPSAPQKQKVAALPSGTAAARTATDAPSILVLRGARGPRYAAASAPNSSPEPLLVVIRGARPRPVILQQYVQPNALILHIRH